jgi:hypothetical protein
MQVIKYKHISGEQAMHMEELPKGSQSLIINNCNRREWSDTWVGGTPVAGKPSEGGLDSEVIIRIPVPNVEANDVLVTNDETYLVINAYGALRAIGIGRIAGRQLEEDITEEDGKLFVGLEEVVDVRVLEGSLMRMMDICCLTEAFLTQNSTRKDPFFRSVEVGSCTAVVEGGKFKINEHEVSGTLEDVERALKAIATIRPTSDIQEGDILELNGEKQVAFVQMMPASARVYGHLVAIYCKIKPDGSCGGGDGWDYIVEGKLRSRQNTVTEIYRDPKTFLWFIGSDTGSPRKYKVARNQLPSFCGFAVVAYESGIKVGCQTITKAQLEELAATLKESKNGSECSPS